MTQEIITEKLLGIKPMAKKWEARETRVRDLIAKYDDILINYGIRTYGLYFPSQVKHMLDGFERETMPVCNHDGSVDISGASRAKIAKILENAEKADKEKTMPELLAAANVPKPSYFQIIQGGKQIGSNWAVSPTQADVTAALGPGVYVINAMDTRGYITGSEVIEVEGKQESNGQGNNSNEMILELMKEIVKGMSQKQPANDNNMLFTYMMKQSETQQTDSAEMRRLLFEKVMNPGGESTDMKSRFEEILAVMSLAKRLNPEGDGWASVALEVVGHLGDSLPDFIDALKDAATKGKEEPAQKQLPAPADFSDLRPAADSNEGTKVQNGKPGEKIIKMQ